jgi:pimeloyl-ACP methyl ester carboxylesterase
VRVRGALAIPLVALVMAGLGAAPAGASPRPPFRAHVHHTAVHGGQIAWYERGTGPPLMMLTGTGSTMSEWDPALLPLLARHHRLTMFDYPGIGRSGPWREPRTFASLADAAENPLLLSNANFHALGSLPMPVLATGGQEDPVVPPLNLIKIARQVPDARLRLFAGAHAFLFQQRAAFAKVVDGFLAG